MSDGLKVVGLDKFDQSVKRWLGAVEKATGEAAVGLAQVMFDQIVENGPQYSGDFVANTTVNVGATPQPRFQEDALGTPLASPHQMGDAEAIQHAWSQAKWPSKLPLGQTLWISSNAAHDEAYAWKIENNEIALRPENAGAYRIYGRALDYAAHRFSYIGHVQLQALQKVTL